MICSITCLLHVQWHPYGSVEHGCFLSVPNWILPAAQWKYAAIYIVRVLRSLSSMQLDMKVESRTKTCKRCYCSYGTFATQFEHSMPISLKVSYEVHVEEFCGEEQSWRIFMHYFSLVASSIVVTVSFHPSEFDSLDILGGIVVVIGCCEGV